MKHFLFVTLLIIGFSAVLKLPTFNLPHKEGDEVAFWYLTKNWIEMKRMKDSFFIDSNIFLYAFSDKDDKQKISKNIVSSSSVVSERRVNAIKLSVGIQTFRFGSV